MSASKKKNGMLAGSHLGRVIFRSAEVFKQFELMEPATQAVTVEASAISPKTISIAVSVSSITGLHSRLQRRVRPAVGRQNFKYLMQLLPKNIDGEGRRGEASI